MASYLILTGDFPDDIDYWGLKPQIVSSTPALIIPEYGPVPDSVLEALPGTVFHFDEDSVLTHVISQSILPGPGLLISPEFAELLQQYSLPPEISFHETTVEDKGEQYLAYWLHVSGFHTDLIDFEKTRFARFPTWQQLSGKFERQESEELRTPDNGIVALGRWEIDVNNEQELLGHLAELALNNGSHEQYDTEEIPEESMIAEPPEKYLDVVGRTMYTTLPVEYDLLVFPFPFPALFVSERLTGKFREFGLTGHTLLPFTYEVYP